MRTMSAVLLACGILIAIGCSTNQPRSTPPDAQAALELESLPTSGVGIGRIIEISLTLRKEWPSSEPEIRALLGSHIPSLNLAGLNALPSESGNVQDETRGAAARLARSPDPQVRFLAIWWIPEDKRPEAYDAFGRELLDMVRRRIDDGGLAQRWLGVAAQLPPSESLERTACELLICRDVDIQRAAAEHLALRHSRLAVGYAVRLMMENSNDYLQRQREAASLLNELAGIEIPWEATASTKSTWLAEILDALAAWNAGRESVPPSPFRLPPKPVVDEGRFIHGDPRQDDIK